MEIPSVSELKKHAKRLKKMFDLSSLSEAQEKLAEMYNVKSWNALSAMSSKKKSQELMAWPFSKEAELAEFQMPMSDWRVDDYGGDDLPEKLRGECTLAAFPSGGGVFFIFRNQHSENAGVLFEVNEGALKINTYAMTDDSELPGACAEEADAVIHVDTRGTHIEAGNPVHAFDHLSMRIADDSLEKTEGWLSPFIPLERHIEEVVRHARPHTKDWADYYKDSHDIQKKIFNRSQNVASALGIDGLVVFNAIEKKICEENGVESLAEIFA